MVVFCLTVFGISARSPVSRVHGSAAIVGSISSSPASGPVGTTITVSGSGWGQPNGTPVTFGYFVNSTCSLVSDSQSGSISGGAFSGWMRWPLDTPVNTYTLCAVIDGATHTAGTFRVLSISAPSVAITPGSLQENQQATIIANNYVPADTAINFFWTLTNGSIVESLGSAISNSVGTALLTFTVPVMPLVSGSYLIEADGGTGQPVPYSATVSFAYAAPVVPPSPTPGPKPSPTVTPAATPPPPAVGSVTATATAAPSPTAGATPTQVNGGATPTAVANGGSGLPTSSSTPATGSGGGGASTSLSSTLLPTVGIIGALVIVIALLALALVLRRRKSRQVARLRSSKGPAGASPGQLAPGQMMMPGMIQPFQQGGQPGAPSLAGQYVGTPYSRVPSPGYGPQYGSGNAQNGQVGAAPVQAPIAYRSLLVSTMPPSNGPTPQNSDGSGVMSPPVDPSLDAMRRRAQTGLFVAPMPPRGGS